MIFLDVAGEVSGLFAKEAHMAGLPTGTVTFLFTDIEGSTRLLNNWATALPKSSRLNTDCSVPGRVLVNAVPTVEVTRVVERESLPYAGGRLRWR